MRLIDADALMKRVCEKECGPHFNIDLCDLDDDSTDTRCVFREYVKAESTIEAEPVRHGRWQWAEGYVGTTAECSVCGLSPMSFYILPKNQIGRLPVYKYCPRCGARMDGGADNG